MSDSKSIPLTCWRHHVPLHDCEECWTKVMRESVFSSMLAEIERLKSEIRTGSDRWAARRMLDALMEQLDPGDKTLADLIIERFLWRQMDDPAMVRAIDRAIKEDLPERFRAAWDTANSSKFTSEEP